MAPTDEPKPAPAAPLGKEKQPQTPEKSPPADFYCPQCGREVDDPLTCGDCSAVICRVCGTPLESAGDLGIG